MPAERDARTADHEFATLRFAHELCSATSLAELEHSFLEGFSRVIDTPLHALYTYDPQTASVMNVVSANVSDMFLARYEQVGRDVDPLMEHVLATGRIAYNAELMSMSEWLESPVLTRVAHLHGMRHVATAPVVNGHGIVGTLHFGTSDPARRLTRHELRVGEYLGRVIGSAIENIEVRRRLERDREHALVALDLAGTAVVVTAPGAIEPQLNDAARTLLAEVVGGEERVYRLVASPGSDSGFSRRLEVELVAGGTALLHGQSRRVRADGDALITVIELQRDEAPLSTRALAALTPREREVAVLVADGLADREIAERLHISHHTVSLYVRRIYRKLDVSSRVALTRLLLRSPR